MSIWAIRISVVLLPLLVWMVLRVPTDGVAVAKDTTMGREIFLQNCALCHINGVALAPRVGEPADWTKRLPAGRRALLESVLRGKGGMPPKGGNASISDAQAEASLDYMLGSVMNHRRRSTDVASRQ